MSPVYLRGDRGVQLAGQVLRVFDHDVLVGEIDGALEDRVGSIGRADDLVGRPLLISFWTISVSLRLRSRRN